MFTNNRPIAEAVTRIVLVLGPAIAFLAIVAWSAGRSEIHLGTLTRDPSSVVAGAWYFGMLSHLSVMLWTASASIALFGATQRSAGENRSFLIAWGLLSILLGLDDALMFHDRLLPQQFGIRERYVILFYAAAAAFIAFHWRKLILQKPISFLFAAFLYFFVSLAFDKLDKSESSLHYLVEDGCKFLGICSWLAWTTQVSWIESSEPRHDR